MPIALWLGTLGGRVSMAVALIVGLGLIRAADVRHQQSVGVQKERASVEKKGNEVDARAQTARRAAEQRPTDSLRNYYRD